MSGQVKKGGQDARATVWGGLTLQIVCDIHPLCLCNLLQSRAVLEKKQNLLPQGRKITL